MSKRLKRWLVYIIAFLGIIPATAGKTDSTRSLLWKITGKNNTKPSYLFGTIHLVCPGDYIWTDAMKRSLDASEEVCLEIDMDNTNALAESFGLLVDPVKKLSDYFTSVDYIKLQQYAKDSLELEPQILVHLKPVAVLMLLTKEAGTLCDVPVSYEENIMKTAKAKKKPIVGLETVAQQMKALESVPADTIVKYVLETISNNNSEDGGDEYMKLVNAYKNQDILKLQEMIASSEGLAAATDVLLNERNRNWIDNMKDIMNRGKSVFFAVGAGHLAGNDGVIALLRQAGYTVTPIR
jgi:hypothetical protein